MKTLVITGLFGLFALEAAAWGGACKYEREIEREVSVNGLKTLKVDAGAGELEISGEGRSTILIKATLCAEKESTLKTLDVASKAEAEYMMLETVFPERSWLNGDGGQATIDLELLVPNDMDLIVRDSSGPAQVSDVASLEMTDSSGELRIEDINGSVSVVDSSGRLGIEDVNGDVRITDSSGAIEVEDVSGELVIEADSSGGIVAQRIGKSVLVKRDSSGAIEVDTVGGDFTVRADTSGGIRYENVGGNVDVPN